MQPILKRIQKILQSRSPVLILLVGFLLVLVIGILDYLTGNDYVLDFFYLLPIFLVIWSVGTKAGLATAVFAIVVEVTANQVLTQASTIWSIKIWNSIFELAVFLSFVAILAALKRDAQVLDSTVSLLNSSLESTEDGILVVDQTGKYVSFNQRYSEMWRIPPAILATRRSDQILPFVSEQLVRPEDFLQQAKELYSQPEKESFDVLDFKDGRTFERYSRPQRIAEKIVGRVWSFRDVTTRKRAQEILLASEKVYHDLFNNTEVGIFRSKLDGSEVLDANDKFLEIFGRLREEVIGKPSVIYWVDPNQREELVRKIQADGRVIDYECKMLNKNGEVLDCITSMTLYPAEGVLDGSILDITARKRAERALRQSDDKLRSLFAAMTDVVIVYDREGRYREIAPTDPALLTAPADELIGKSMSHTFPKPEADRLIQVVHTVLDTGKKMEIEYSLQIGGRTIWFACAVSPMQADSVIWVAHDITNRKRAGKLQEVIYAISQAAISTESLDELYRSIHTTLAELVPVDNFYIAIYDPTSDRISFPYYVDQFDQPPSERRPRRGFTEYVLRTGQTLSAPPQVYAQLIQKGEVEVVGTPPIDWLGVPLIVEGQVIGVMVTQSYQENTHFNLEDLRLFEFVSTQVAQMIDRKRIEQKIRYMGIHDALTGLYNRAYFDEELKRLEHGRLFPISVLMADLDKLKVTNDLDGHAAGDELLRQAAKALRAAFRAEDVVARIGGDEFGVLLPGMDAVLVTQAKQRILENIKKQNATYQGKPLLMSMGVSTIDKGGSLVEALKVADDLMYAEKQSKIKN